LKNSAQIKEFIEDDGMVSLVFYNEQHLKKIKNIALSSIQMPLSVSQISQEQMSSDEVKQISNKVTQHATKTYNKTSCKSRNKQKPQFFPDCIKEGYSESNSFGSVTPMSDYMIASLNDVFIKKVSPELINENIAKIPPECQSGVLDRFMTDLFWAPTNTIPRDKVMKNVTYDYTCDFDLVRFLG